MNGELAGRLRTRVSVSRDTGARDALGGGGGWAPLGTIWAEVRPEGRVALFAGEARAGLPLWRVTMRGRDLRVGDRIGWGARTMIVRETRDDPALADRIVAIAEEER